MRSLLLLFTGVTGVLFLAAACGGKTTGAIGGGDGGPSGSSSGGGSGSTGGGSGGGGSGGSSGSAGGSSSGGVTSYCETTNTLPCSGGGAGFVCTDGLSPVTADPSLSCSTPTSLAGGLEGYCCFGFTSPPSTCTPDDNLPACAVPGIQGYQCIIGDDPTSSDPSLNCSAPQTDPDGVHQDYCCAYAGSSGGSGSSSGGPVPDGCTADASIDCSGGAQGWSCASGYNPEAESPGLSCSSPTASSDGTDDYCCFSGFPSSTTGCVPDDALTSVCPDPDSYGFQCDSGDDPAAFDAQLDCSQSTPDPDGLHDDFCCTY